MLTNNLLFSLEEKQFVVIRFFSISYVIGYVILSLFASWVDFVKRVSLLTLEQPRFYHLLVAIPLDGTSRNRDIYSFNSKKKGAEPWNLS